MHSAALLSPRSIADEGMLLVELRRDGQGCHLGDPLHLESLLADDGGVTPTVRPKTARCVFQSLSLALAGILRRSRPRAAVASRCLTGLFVQWSANVSIGHDFTRFTIRYLLLLFTDFIVSVWLTNLAIPPLPSSFVTPLPDVTRISGFVCLWEEGRDFL